MLIEKDEDNPWTTESVGGADKEKSGEGEFVPPPPPLLVEDFEPQPSKKRVPITKKLAAYRVLRSNMAHVPIAARGVAVPALKAV